MRFAHAPVVLAALAAAVRADDLAEALARADAASAAARAEPDPPKRAKAVDAALAAYDALLAERPKDPETVPRIRRRRATLLAAGGRPAEAMAEHDRILAGPSSRRDRARALLDGARLLQRGSDFHGAERRAARVVDEYGDELELGARAWLLRGDCNRSMARLREAEACYRRVVDRFGDEAEACIASFDALAILEIEARRPDGARRWLKACAEKFEKRAARGDRYGAMVGRLLGEMKAPSMLGGGPAERR